MTPTTKRELALITVILLGLAATRLLRLHGLDMHTDEIWSVWQTFGTPADILRWTPFDWPPLSYLLIGGWRVLVGLEPEALRVLPVLWFMLATATLYRAVRYLGTPSAARFAVLVWAALGSVLRFSTEIRGYMFMLLLLTAALWFTVRYFAAQQAQWRRALPLSLALVGMFYTYLPSVFGMAALGLFTLLTYPRRVLRWWRVGVIAGPLAVPLIVAMRGATAERVAGNWPYPPLADAWRTVEMLVIFRYDGVSMLVWVGLLALAAGILVWRRGFDRVAWGFGAWALLLPLGLYIGHPLAGLFRDHYGMALTVGLAAFIGWGLAQAGRWGQRAAVLGLTVLLAWPVHLSYYAGYWRDWDEQLSWLAQRYRPADRVVVDPNCCLGHHYEWDYMVRRYFPQGLNFADHPGEAARVWYITYEGRQDTDLAGAVRDGRIAREFIGPTEFLFRLYEAPPDREGLPFPNGMRFHGAQIIDERGHPAVASGPVSLFHEGDTVRVRLWWAVDESPTLDYSVSLRLVPLADADPLDGAAISDSPPQTVTLTVDGTPPPAETSQWQPGRFYIEDRALTLPYPTAYRGGEYVLKLAVYFWQDGTPLPVPGADGDGLLTIGRVAVDAW